MMGLYEHPHFKVTNEVAAALLAACHPAFAGYSKEAIMRGCRIDRLPMDDYQPSFAAQAIGDMCVSELALYRGSEKGKA